MGNRFLMLEQYHTLIRGHGVIAALTFLCIVPSAIMIARFKDRSPRWALRLHIWLQILTVALTTVVFVLGYFAVGPERSWTNPHHGIGLTIFVLVLIQAVGGWWVHSREKGRKRMYIPLKLMVRIKSALQGCRDQKLLYLRLLVPSMAWTRDRITRSRTDPHRSYALWFTGSIVRSLRPRNCYPRCRLFCLDISTVAAYRV